MWQWPVHTVYVAALAGVPFKVNSKYVLSSGSAMVSVVIVACCMSANQITEREHSTL